jgi:hypothetical protein
MTDRAARTCNASMTSRNNACLRVVDRHECIAVRLPRKVVECCRDTRPRSSADIHPRTTPGIRSPLVRVTSALSASTDAGLFDCVELACRSHIKGKVKTCSIKPSSSIAPGPLHICATHASRPASHRANDSLLQLQEHSRGSAPEEGGVGRVVRAALAVRAAVEAHDVVPPLLHEHANDALDAVADKDAAKLVRLLKAAAPSALE